MHSHMEWSKENYHIDLQGIVPYKNIFLVSVSGF